MKREEMRKYFMEKYGIDIDTMPSEKVEPKDYERELIYDLPEDLLRNDEPFSTKPHNAIRTSGKKPASQCSSIFDDYEEK